MYVHGVNSKTVFESGTVSPGMMLLSFWNGETESAVMIGKGTAWFSKIGLKKSVVDIKLNWKKDVTDLEVPIRGSRRRE